MPNAPGSLVDRVIKYLSGQPTSDGMRKIRLVVLVPAVRADRKLVDARLANQLDEMLNIEIVLDEFVGRVVRENTSRTLTLAAHAENAPA